MYPLFAVYNFQENLIRTMLQLEQTFFDLAATCKKDALVICDRGAMDPSSCKSHELLPSTCLTGNCKYFPGGMGKEIQ